MDTAPHKGCGKEPSCPHVLLSMSTCLVTVYSTETVVVKQEPGGCLGKMENSKKSVLFLKLESCIQTPPPSSGYYFMFLYSRAPLL